MSIKIDIPYEVLEVIGLRAHANPTEEVCGVVIRGEHTPIKNIAKDRDRRFRMDPGEQMDAWNTWKREGEMIVYHSHPRGSASPSREDQWVIARSEDITFLIYSVADKEFKAYRSTGIAIIGIEINRVGV